MVAQKEEENKTFLKEVLNIDSSFIEAEGIKNTLKYFDRLMINYLQLTIF
jgi:hypothetical protein